MQTNSLEKITILGFARSGQALAELSLARGLEVKVSEAAEAKQFEGSLITRFKNKGVCFEFGGHNRQFVKDSDIVVVSPGIDTKQGTVKDLLCGLRQPVVGELEFASWFIQGKIIAITGSNGKTTTTSLVYHVLNNFYNNVYLAGNIGYPLSRFVVDSNPDSIFVIEVSSFQLETIDKFKPDIACLLNLAPDHLDRYQNLKDYYQAKFNIFKNQDQNQWALLNRNLADNKDLDNIVKSRKVYFDAEFIDQNYSAALKIAELAGIRLEAAKSVLKGFNNLAHRVEAVASIKGVKFINDSKATNPAATAWALTKIKGPIILIAGGKDKELDYSLIYPYLEKIKKVNLIGEAADKISEVLKNKVKLEKFSSLADAIKDSYNISQSQDTVLFSPMCSSFDMFRDYQHRGQEFKRMVEEIRDSVQSSTSDVQR
jgi:UDP-N-acetylmuramoylalanine--D-glutamate ligase